MEVYITIFFRIVTIMFLLLFSTLFIMGKRPIGELPVFDFLSIIVMGAIVGADIADPEIKHMPTAFAVVILAVFQRTVSFMTLRSSKLRKKLTFEPTIVIQNGKYIYENLKRLRYSVDDLLMLLREKDIFDVSMVSYGIIEANGNLSILKKAEYETVTRKDANIPYSSDTISFTVILDGKLIKDNLRILHITEEELVAKLKTLGYEGYEDIFYASMDSNRNLAVSSYLEASPK